MLSQGWAFYITAELFSSFDYYHVFGSLESEIEAITCPSPDPFLCWDFYLQFCAHPLPGVFTRRGNSHWICYSQRQGCKLPTFHHSMQ